MIRIFGTCAALVVALGCAKHHRVEVFDAGGDARVPDAGRDSGIDSGVDSGRPCAPEGFERTDVRASGRRPGPLLVDGDRVLWVEHQSATELAILDRRTGAIETRTVGMESSQFGSLARVGELYVLAYEVTGVGGVPEGVVLVTLIAETLEEVTRDAGSIRSPRTGHPIVLAGSGGDVLLAYDREDQVNVERVVAATLRRREGWGLGGAGGLVSAHRQDDLVYVGMTRAAGLVRDPPSDGELLFSVPRGEILRDLAPYGDGTLVVALTDEDRRALVQRRTLDGEVLEQRGIDAERPSDDARVAVFGGFVLATARLPGESVIVDGALEVVQPLEPLFRNPFLAVTDRGFVAIGTDGSVSDSVLSFLEPCAP